MGDQVAMRRCVARILALDLGLERSKIPARGARAQYAHLVDFDKQRKVERRVTEYIQDHLSFVVFRGEEPDHR